ncbi:MAG: hypothetical protein Q8Q40_01960 [Methylococcaceae bacterium]|nr:hypothetical protein [Methylococcaceae bacterium]MDP3902725.1 hypothetical protein [Methylococcaceae bacterium]
MKRIALLSLVAAISTTALAAPETYVIDGTHTYPNKFLIKSY